MLSALECEASHVLVGPAVIGICTCFMPSSPQLQDNLRLEQLKVEPMQGLAAQDLLEAWMLQRAERTHM